MTRRESGFSLIEVIAATTLLGIASVGILGSIGQSIAAASTARDHERAALFARSRMNAILASPLLTAGERGGEHNADGYSWEVYADWAEQFPADARGGRVLRLRMVVWWRVESERRSIRLDAYRRASGP